MVENFPASHVRFRGDKISKVWGKTVPFPSSLRCCHCVFHRLRSRLHHQLLRRSKADFFGVTFWEFWEYLWDTIFWEYFFLGGVIFSLKKKWACDEVTNFWDELRDMDGVLDGTLLLSYYLYIYNHWGQLSPKMQAGGDLCCKLG